MVVPPSSWTCEMSPFAVSEDGMGAIPQRVGRVQVPEDHEQTAKLQTEPREGDAGGVQRVEVLGRVAHRGEVNAFLHDHPVGAVELHKGTGQPAQDRVVDETASLHPDRIVLCKK